MLNILCFEDIENFLPLLAMPIIFIVIIAIVVTAVIKRVKAEENRRREINEGQAQRTFLDGNGRTEQQRDYLASKRRELADRKVASNDGHSHTGRRETYSPIVGSLGEVNDEGCDELDGVRLIEHDEAYCDDPDHIISTEPTELERAIVLGEVLNTPRYKQMYRRK